MTSTQATPEGILPGGPTMVTPYFLRDGKVAPGEPRPTSGDAHVEAVQILAAGPNELEKSAGLTTALQENVHVLKLTVSEGLVTVDLSRTFETHRTQPQVAQVTYTLTQFPGIEKVKFLIEGQDNGATGVPPVNRDAFATYTPDVLLESPWPGMQAHATLKVSGNVDPTLSSFAYRIETAFGETILTGTITAKFGTGRKKFDQSVDIPPGTAGLVYLVVGRPESAMFAPFRIPFTAST